MPEPKSQPKPMAKAEPEEFVKLAPAGETTNPAVQQLLAELQTLRANGALEDAQDVVAYLNELGYDAG